MDATIASEIKSIDFALDSLIGSAGAALAYASPVGITRAHSSDRRDSEVKTDIERLAAERDSLFRQLRQAEFACRDQGTCRVNLAGASPHVSVNNHVSGCLLPSQDAFNQACFEVETLRGRCTTLEEALRNANGEMQCLRAQRSSYEAALPEKCRSLEHARMAADERAEMNLEEKQRALVELHSCKLESQAHVLELNAMRAEVNAYRERDVEVRAQHILRESLEHKLKQLIDIVGRPRPGSQPGVRASSREKRLDDTLSVALNSDPHESLDFVLAELPCRLNEAEQSQRLQEELVSMRRHCTLQAETIRQQAECLNGNWVLRQQQAVGRRASTVDRVPFASIGRVSGENVANASKLAGPADIEGAVMALCRSIQQDAGVVL